MNKKPKRATHNVQKWSVQNDAVCLQCFVHAHNRKEAIEMAEARNDLFRLPGTEASIVVNGVAR